MAQTAWQHLHLPIEITPLIFILCSRKSAIPRAPNSGCRPAMNWVKNQNLEMYGGEKSISRSLIVENRYNAVSNTSINAKFTVNNIEYTGTANTTTSYIMLGGLLPGKNYLWTLSFTKRLVNNLELNFDYEGRKPGNSRTINIGRASVRALL